MLLRMGTRSVMMLGPVVPVMTLATLLIHDRLLNGVGVKGKTAIRIIGKTVPRRNEYATSEAGRTAPAGHPIDAVGPGLGLFWPREDAGVAVARQKLQLINSRSDAFSGQPPGCGPWRPS
jgi:hypothetical protein